MRDRPWDIPILLEHYYKKRTLGFTPEALRALASYAWPGNVRDLSRACALFVIHAQPGAPIDRALLQQCLPEILQGTPSPKAGPLLWQDLSFRDAVRQFERELLLARLEHHGGNVKAARESLGLSKATFHRYLKALGIKGGGPEA